jgi:hypothetical protein
MNYVLILTANNDEQAQLIFETLREAETMREAFMLMGQYRDAKIFMKVTNGPEVTQ